MNEVSAKTDTVRLHTPESPALATTECEQGVVECHREEGDSAKEKCIHELFREQAERNPGATATVCGDRELTYGELNHRSNHLARTLRELGVGSETLVAICLERSLEMIVGLLGTLKAGGAYVPMDPSYPKERLAFMLEDTQAQVLLTNRALHARLPETGAKAVYLDNSWQDIQRCSTDEPGPLVTPHNLAYVIYTSGSTGRPKGAMIEHSGIVNLVYQYRELYCIEEGIRISQTAGASFDAMGSEVWPTLLSGAALYIAPAEVRVDPELLQRWLIDQRISIAFATTVIAERLLALPWPRADVALRVLRFGGERFRGRPGNRVYPFRIYNEYGPTEDTVWTTVAEVIDDSGNEANIGRPFANHRVYVLDSNQNPVPAGEAGELCIGGVGLARGYLNRPELTAEKFITKPCGEYPNERFYRTGDVAHYLPDASLEFLGRIDDQVKIRGFRVEPGEIEVALTQHPSVRQCAVIARENRLGDKRILAYVVAGREQDEGVSESLADRQIAERKQALPADLSQQLASKLRSYLSDKLPDYMVPSGFVFLDRLPLTPNGKIDRRALPPPGLVTSRFVEPQTPLQRKLAEIWQDALDVENVGLTDNFFELGGDSLSAVRIVLKIERILGQRIPLATLFQTPTIEKLAVALQAQDWKSARSILVPIQPHGSRPPFFAVHTLSGEVMFYQGLAQCLGENQPFYGIQVEGLDGSPIRHRTMETIAHYYIDEIRGVQAHGPYCLGGYCIGGIVAFEMAQQLRAAGEEVACLALIEADKPEPASRDRTLRQRIRTMLNEAVGLSLGEKAQYFRRRVERKLKWEISRLQKEGNDLLQQLLRALAQDAVSTVSATDPVRSPVGKMLARAQSEYKPRVYPGRIILFRAAVPDDDQLATHRGWGEIAAGGVEIHDIPGEHQTVFEPRHVPTLAKELDVCLRVALNSQTKC